jgi:nucleoid-associated protein YgaU
MKTSYKVALIAASVLFVTVLGLQFFPEDASAQGSPPVSPKPPAAAPAKADQTKATAPMSPLPDQVRRAAVAGTGVSKVTAAKVKPSALAPKQAASVKTVALAKATIPPMRVKLPLPVVDRQSPAVRSASIQTRASTKPKTYTIKQDDSFSSIAKALFGSQRYTMAVAQANPLVDPLKLQSGQVIRLPEIASSAARAVGVSVVAAKRPGLSDGSRYYLIRDQDTLTEIARAQYGDQRLWYLLYRANRSDIGPNPDRIQPGLRIKLPPRLTAAAGGR